MEITKDIPAKRGILHRVDSITIELDERIARVDINSSEGHHQARVDLIPLITATTTTQKAIIRGFIKAIIAAAVEVEESTLLEVLPEK